MFLITGADGQLGQELRLRLKDNAVCVGHRDLDITDAAAVKNFTAAQKFDAVINCAAYTAVDQAETDAETARRVNVDGPRNLAACGLPLIHISTDYVFDGHGCRPYREDDAANPLQIYGKTKRDGELAILQTAETAVIIRTSWLYSGFGSNFVKTMRRLGSEREMLNVVFDQTGTPTYAADLAAAIIAVLPQIVPGRREIYHYSNEGVCSWYDFAREIMRLSGLKCRVAPIESKDYPTPAARPSYSVLNKAKIKHDFGLNINHWQESLQQCLKKLS